ncbi:hypothetical protein WwAna0058, partial [Wolbachia endosymbiont of Drosophila ananassae]
MLDTGMTPSLANNVRTAMCVTLALESRKNRSSSQATWMILTANFLCRGQSFTVLASDS